MNGRKYNIITDRRHQRPMLFKIVLKDEMHLMKLREGQKYQDLCQYVARVFKKLPLYYHLAYIDDDGDSINLDNQHDLMNLLQLGLNKVNVQIVPVSHIEQTQPQTEPQKGRETQKKYETDWGREISQKVQPSAEVMNQNEKMQQIRSPSIMKQKHGLFVQQVNQSQEETWSLITRKISANHIAIEQRSKERESKQILGGEKKEKARQQDQKSGQKLSMSIEQAQDPKHNFIHDEVTCDVCRVSPVIGNRFKCSVCPDYDLCETCEQDHAHDHALIKIKYKDQEFTTTSKNDTTLAILGQSLINGGQSLINGGRAAMNGLCFIVKTIMGKSETLPKVIDKEKEKREEQKKNLMKAEKVQEKAIVKEKPRELTQEDKLLDSANYLHSILGIDFNRCYAFVKKHRGLSNQELVVQYFDNVKGI